MFVKISVNLSSHSYSIISVEKLWHVSKQCSTSDAWRMKELSDLPNKWPLTDRHCYPSPLQLSVGIVSHISEVVTLSYLDVAKKETLHALVLRSNGDLHVPVLDAHRSDHIVACMAQMLN